MRWTFSMWTTARVQSWKPRLCLPIYATPALEPHLHPPAHKFRALEPRPRRACDEPPQ